MVTRTLLILTELLIHGFAEMHHGLGHHQVVEPDLVTVSRLQMGNGPELLALDTGIARQRCTNAKMHVTLRINIVDAKGHHVEMMGHRAGFLAAIDDIAVGGFSTAMVDARISECARPSANPDATNKSLPATMLSSP
ncbi:hypothetical protein CUU62_22315 [Pseudomonas sp. WP001]|nr:hypothetical protein CUU62_22315 [Pseudomonas sp. WP001]